MSKLFDEIHFKEQSSEAGYLSKSNFETTSFIFAVGLVISLLDPSVITFCFFAGMSLLFWILSKLFR